MISILTNAIGWKARLALSLLVLSFCVGDAQAKKKKTRKKRPPKSTPKYQAPKVDPIKVAEKTLAYIERRVDLPKLGPALRSKIAAYKKSPNDRLLGEIKALRRQVIFRHPRLNFDRLLINVNPPTKYSHNGDQYLGQHSRPGPGLAILSNWKSGKPTIKYLVKGKLPSGACRNPDLNYDADKVVFAFCPHSGPYAPHKRYFLYEAAIDGSWVRQLTGTARDPFATQNNLATVKIEDNDPCYLPDGNIVFVSTRTQSFGRCHGGRYNPAWVLYKCDKNGDNITQLSYGNENEHEPYVLNDGRIVFTRWEYTDRHEMWFHKLWWCNPDGSNVSHFFGNDMTVPMMIVEAVAIPGTHKVVATAMGHHSYSTGTTVVIDTNKGENGEQCIQHITPETPYSETFGWPSPHYSHPYAVDDNIFFVSRANHPVHKQGKTPPPNDRAIYLVDSFGGREKIYEDPNVASFSPIPLIKRKRPPVKPSVLPPKAPEMGTLFVQNAYLTRNDPEKKIKPGTIKYLRINALGVKPYAKAKQCSATVKVEIPKKVLGIVPVSEDGSAFFKAPANISLQVQTLDQYGRALLTEKSFFYLKPGENRGCIGCHEEVGTSPIMSAIAKNSRKQPVDLKTFGPQYAGGLSFARSVQPVLDRYCIGCHGLDKTEKKINLVYDKPVWPRSAMVFITRGKHQLGFKKYMQSGKGQYDISRPMRFYAYSNKVIDMLIKGHHKVKLDTASRFRLIEWLDLNAQVFGDQFTHKLEERTIDKAGMSRLRAELRKVYGAKIAGQPERALVNVAQPDESRCLQMGLAGTAGGWGQMTKWQSRDDAGYKRIAQLVDKAIRRSSNENLYGWEPRQNTGGAESYILRERQAYVKKVKANKLMK